MATIAPVMIRKGVKFKPVRVNKLIAAAIEVKMCCQCVNSQRMERVAICPEGEAGTIAQMWSTQWDWPRAVQLLEHLTDLQAGIWWQCLQGGP